MLCLVHTQCTTDNNLIFRENGTITFENILVNVSKEHLLDASGWCKAIFHMCDNIECYLPRPYSKTIADQWHLHAEQLLGKSDFVLNFCTYLAYDIHLHQAYVHDFRLFCLDKFQWAMWDAVKDKQQDKKFRSIEHAITNRQLPYYPTIP